MKNTEKTMEKVVALCKGRGFVYPGSEIYGGLANTWDYGPLGVELKNNVKKAWWKKFIQESPYNVGLDAAILMNPQTWVASGHVGGFSDPLMDCKECKSRHRADKLIEDYMFEKGEPTVVDGWSDEKMLEFIKENNIACPKCGKTNFTDIRKFNLMFKTFQGVTEDSSAELFLRPETAKEEKRLNYHNTNPTCRSTVKEVCPGFFFVHHDDFSACLKNSSNQRIDCPISHNEFITDFKYAGSLDGREHFAYEAVPDYGGQTIYGLFDINGRESFFPHINEYDNRDRLVPAVCKAFQEMVKEREMAEGKGLGRSDGKGGDREMGQANEAKAEKDLGERRGLRM